MATPKPTDLQLLRDVKDRLVDRHTDFVTGYDWNTRTGRDVTVQMRRLERGGLVHRVELERDGMSVRANWRLTRAGRAVALPASVPIGGA